MKKFLTIIVFALCLSACGNKKANTNEVVAEEKITVDSNLPVYELDDLLAVADQQVDKEVIVKGFVTHTCKHSGKRCFIVGNNENASMRVEAGGNIGGFNRELVGSELAINGIVKENRLTKEYINRMEEELKGGTLKEDGSAESCQAELNNINEMRKWMKDNNKDYYSIYYLNGTNYEVITK
ncbi:MAG: hypothetical protein LBN74_01240 [Prevotella sp.]|jgi:hypothetical protein|nr:hypothetical protein [Prevotella sp.]